MITAKASRSHLNKQHTRAPKIVHTAMSNTDQETTCMTAMYNSTGRKNRTETETTWTKAWAEQRERKCAT